MFRILCKSLHSFGRTTSKPHKLFILGLQECSSSAITANKPIPECVNQDSFTVGYLMTHFGFSLEKAVLASKKLYFKDCNKPNVVVTFLKNQGFTHTQICQVISAETRILTYKPEKTLLPKIEFFRSKGVSSTDLARMIAFNIQLLTSSLKYNISPSFDFLRDLLGSDQSVIHVLKLDPRILVLVERRVKPNIEIMREAGVPYSTMAFLFRNRPRLFVHRLDKVKAAIEEVQKMGLDPNSSSYGVALSILTVTSRSKWNEKVEAYKRWGCSEDEVIRTFKILPWIMNLSVEKINNVMSFAVNEMGWEPSQVMRRYFILPMSLNKRIMPRWSVFQELVSKRLVKGECKFRTLFKLKEDLFLEKYVNCYKNEAPMLLKLYLEKMESSKC